MQWDKKIKTEFYYGGFSIKTEGNGGVLYDFHVESFVTEKIELRGCNENVVMRIKKGKVFVRPASIFSRQGYWKDLECELVQFPSHANIFEWHREELKGFSVELPMVFDGWDSIQYDVHFDEFGKVTKIEDKREFKHFVDYFKRGFEDNLIRRVKVKNAIGSKERIAYFLGVNYCEKVSDTPLSIDKIEELIINRLQAA